MDRLSAEPRIILLIGCADVIHGSFILLLKRLQVFCDLFSALSESIMACTDFCKKLKLAFSNLSERPSCR